MNLLRLARDRIQPLTAPVTVANDRCSGGVRYQDGVAITAIQLIGKPHRATMLIGATMSQTENTLDLSSLLAVLRTNLGMTFESASVVSAGARRRSSGDYPRVYDTFIGTSPYAGHRESWLLVRINACDNADSIRLRATVGAAVLAATQRVASALSCNGIRARVATATEIADLDRRLEVGCLTSYGLKSLGADALAMPWSLRVDRVITNHTLFPDATVASTVTIGTPQPPPVTPSTALQPFPLQQKQLLRGHQCGPRPRLRGLARRTLPLSMSVPLGSSGVLLGRVAIGDRLLMPLDHPGGHSHVHIAADDAIAKRIVVRTVAAGGDVTVNTPHPDRWDNLRMPNLLVADQPRNTRPGTAISVGEIPPGAVDVAIIQTGPATVSVRTADRVHEVEVDFFRAENRYAA